MARSDVGSVCVGVNHGSSSVVVTELSLLLGGLDWQLPSLKNKTSKEKVNSVLFDIELSKVTNKLSNTFPGADPTNSERGGRDFLLTRVQPKPTTHEHPWGYFTIPLERRLPSINVQQIRQKGHPRTTRSQLNPLMISKKVLGQR